TIKIKTCCFYMYQDKKKQEKKDLKNRSFFSFNSKLNPDLLLLFLFKLFSLSFIPSFSFVISAFCFNSFKVILGLSINSFSNSLLNWLFLFLKFIFSDAEYTNSLNVSLKAFKSSVRSLMKSLV